MFSEITRFFSSDVRIINLQQRPRVGEKRLGRKKETKKKRRGKKIRPQTRGSAGSRQRYLSTTQKGEYQAIKGIYMNSARVPTFVSEKLGVRHLESIERTRGQRDGGDKSGAK